MLDFIVGLFWFLLIVGGALALAYKRVDLKTATIAAAAGVLAYQIFGDGYGVVMLVLWLIVGIMAALNLTEFRRDQITAPMLKKYRTMLPQMSDTEREALEAGSVWWDGELFTGLPEWNRLMSMPAPRLSDEEQAFYDGPTEELCRMLDEWEICHELGDMPPHIWEYIKEKRFFAMIIPKEYGGLEFSAYANALILQKLSGRSTVAASTIGVPNSLGPAELLLHYGTDEQKQRYLPGLASGDEIPCFALTSPQAGSDAAAIVDEGVVCKGRWQGKEVIGMRLTWNKRYITLAPIATVLGLAFKLRDPDGLIGDVADYGITAALIPTNTPGVEHGRRHYPLDVPFMNGPTSGKDVFVPLDYIIGGPEMAGKGWKMLVELLSVGRAITLPSSGAGGGQAATYATGAYARIRRQFNLPIGMFEGVGEALARMAGRTYIMNAAVSVTAGAITEGEAPAVPSAVLKYHCTELARKVANDGMDIHGGKAVMMGPRNYMGRGYMALPIAITVEGANILTRSLIVFGQGAIRCHPWVLKELHAAQNPDTESGLDDFDDALFGHIGYAISNAARAFVLALTHARYSEVPVEGPTRRYFQNINRYSAAFALTADFAMLTLGGRLKIKEQLSARLGDVFSSMYLASAVLKHYENQGRQPQDLPLVEWSVRTLMYDAQEQLHKFLQNFPNRPVAWLLRMLVFPRGRTYSAPSDKIGRSIVDLMINPTDARERLCAQVYKEQIANNPAGMLQAALERAVVVEPLERKLRDAVKAGTVPEAIAAEQIEAAVEAGVLTSEEAGELSDYHARIAELIAVDDFDTSEIGRTQAAPAPAARPTATRKKATRKKAPAAKKKPTRTAAKKKATGKKTTRKKATKKTSAADNGKDEG
ncbi:MAG: acyl-CoA dehydrogenase [Pseudomonadota bacterium]